MMSGNMEKNHVPAETMRSVVLAIIKDMFETTSGWSGYERARDSLVSHICALGTRREFFTCDMPKVGKLFDGFLANGRALPRTEVRSLLEKAVGSPSFMDWYFRVCFREDLSVDPKSHAVVKFVRQVCYLFYKLRGGEPPESHAAVIDRFIETEAEVSRLSFDKPGDYAYLEVMRVVMCHLVGAFDPRDIIPRHGPGAVSTGEKPAEKMNFKRFIPRLDAEYPYMEYFHLNLDHWIRHAHIRKWRVSEPSARVVLVPKDSRGPRVISCEPLEFQWIQQGLMRALTAWIEQHPLTRGRVNFTDQRVNQELARLGSLNGDLVTLDLKDASDRVSLELLRRVLPPLLYRKVAAARSLTTELPDGRIIELKKFAPMGSALCFPIMALVIFASVITSRVLSRRPSIKVSSQDILEDAKHVTVFGDDLIVPRSSYGSIKDGLERIGLMLNADKCCIGSFFKESCGADWFRGVSVTPLRIKTVYPWDRSPEGHLATIAYANAFARSGYSHTASLLGRLAESEGKLPRTGHSTQPIDFGFEESTGNGTPFVLECSDGKLARRWNCRYFKARFNRDLQRDEFLVPVATNKTIRGGTCWGEYFRWHVLRVKEGSSFRYAIPHRVVKKQRWTNL